MTETAVVMRRSDLVQFKSAVFPDPTPLGSFDVLDGQTIRLQQPLRIRTSADPGEARVAGYVEYQVCKADLCLPPDSIAFRAAIDVKGIEQKQIEHGE